MPRLLSFVFFGIALITWSPARMAHAQATATTTFQVTATVRATCQVSATALAFGTYTGASVDATSIISVTCTNTTAYNIGLDAGSAPGATVTTRQMTGPSGDMLNYGLYRDTGHSQNWGITVGTDTVTGIGSGSLQTVTVYGRLPASQFVTPGAYSDTITATVSY
ncbi:Csu type fimbrial protein [Nitrospirillum viridazoti]|uniref:Spore coat protein n=2 Tax=Nitrospirillum TaxID=1543705 RepID=A0A248JPP0_9PROT|nr:spore coat U domain-containing protein [Nitrospirillum amazonense]ASG20480.1 spore coat protein [Nitrospirillum amazonense CBAmc]TWB34888.1 spore coat protein U-like protein [Nitrospirillum amazonense]TWB63606.1 spore coat protein U-like protein [Nitrospirillum amazonense]